VHLKVYASLFSKHFLLVGLQWDVLDSCGYRLFLKVALHPCSCMDVACSHLYGCTCARQNCGSGSRLEIFSSLFGALVSGHVNLNVSIVICK
jgi:hypothetical protein